MMTYVATVLFVKLTIMNQNAHVQKEPLEILTLSVLELKVAVQTVSVLQIKLVLTVNVLHPVTVVSMLNALLKTIKQIANVPMVTLEIHEKFVVHP